jgi:predicted transcriptional regulator
MDSLVLAITQENADAILDGKRRFDHRKLPPKRLPARAYLAVSGEGVVGECELGAPERQTDLGWALPVSRPRRYRSARGLDRYGLRKTPRSFQYLNSPASTRSSRA